MSRYLKLEQLDPYRLFAIYLRRSRLGLEAAYLAAFAAAQRCSDLQNDILYMGLNDSQTSSPSEIEALNLAAQAEDLQADLHASTLTLAADDALRRFGAALLGKPLPFQPGYGPSYNGVKLTTLLRTATNTLRHVSEWDDMNLLFPYRVNAKLNPKKDRDEILALRSIRIIQKAFGIGTHEQIRDVVSWRVVVAIDGQLGSAVPDFDRFEGAILSAAHEIASSVGGLESDQLNAALAAVGLKSAPLRTK